MLLQKSRAQSTTERVVDLQSIDVSGAGLQFKPPKFVPRAVRQEATLSLVHLDIALAIELEAQDDGSSADGGPCFRISAKRLAETSRNAEETSAAGEFKDPVLHRLSDALAAAEAAHDPHSRICADALRLAVIARKFSLQAAPGRGGNSRSDADEDHAGRSVQSLQKWRLRRVLRHIDHNLGTKITLQEMAKVAGRSRMHFAAQFKAAIGMRPHEYLLKRRIERARELLKQAEISLVDIALMVGFQTQAHFTTVFKRFAGNTPYQWRSAYLAQSAPLPTVRRRLSWPVSASRRGRFR